MPEPIAQWWARRQFSRGAAVPYPVGSYREAWSSYPMLIRQYHPDLNDGITLTQIPPAADVYLRWQCDAGHIFVATPSEQRARPGRERRRSSWCPDCLAAARPRPVRPANESAESRRARRTPPPREQTLCRRTPPLTPGAAFVSVCAPATASVVEAELRAGLLERLKFSPEINAVRLPRAFFDHLEAWPDLVLPELRVAIEYDSTGRHGLEHVGPREAADRRKDRALRGVGWEVVRIRTGRLPAIGPYDLQVASVTRRLYPQLLDRLRDIRGPMLVDAYLR